METSIILKDAFKAYTRDQDKTLPPEETVRRFKEKLKEIDLDILEETRRIDNGRLDIPVYFSHCGQDAMAVTGTRKQMGKGASPEQAEASAVMELAERFSFFSFTRNPAHFFTDTHHNLRGKALPFSRIAASVHDTSPDLDVARKIFEDLPLRWTPGYDLTEGGPVLLPFDWFFTINEFNGPCAGNCAEEALSQGICEVVERHVCSIVSRDRLDTPAISLDGETDPEIRSLAEKYRAAGVRLHLSDFTLDTGIPTVAALAHDPATFPEKSEIVWTAGTTPSPRKALIRALTEVAQLGGDFNTGSNYVASGLPKFKDLEEARYVLEPEKTVALSSLPDLSNPNIRCEVEACLSALSDKGMAVYAVDVTHPLLEIPAYYTVIPGAHFRERTQAASVGMWCAKLMAETLPPETAISRLDALEARLPGRYYTQFYLGMCLLSLGRVEAALGRFRKALDLDVEGLERPTIYAYMGVCHKEMGGYREALEVLAAGEAIDPNRTDILNLMGFCHFKLKEHEAAIRSFKKVLRIDPGSAIDYANIASNYRDMGETEKAVEYYLMALALDPTIDFARQNLDKLRNGA